MKREKEADGKGKGKPRHGWGDKRKCHSDKQVHASVDCATDPDQGKVRERRTSSPKS